jgi:alkylation response protein AidB-like acyl-CoA dehydrogenase
VEHAEYQRLRERIFAAFWDELAALVEEIEAERRIPHERVWAVLREAGALGLLVPPECGGSGLTISQYVPVIAELAKVHGGLRVLLHVHNSFAHAVAELGTDQQRRELLPGVARGELSIAFALTERDRGTGADIGTTARHEGGEYVLDGRKWLITNSNFASHFLVVVRTGEARGQALSILLVERETPGLTIEPMPPTMGCIGGEHGELTFEGVRASRECLLGGVEGRGEEQLKRALDVSRLLIAASSLGVAEYALALSLARAQERVTFGRPIAERQAIQRYLAEMATDVYALRTMLEDAAAKFDSGERAPAEAAMCKLFGLEAVARVTDRALLVFGGIGYTRATSIERLYRDARLNWLEEGPPTVQHLTIARQLLQAEPDGRKSDDQRSLPRGQPASRRSRDRTPVTQCGEDVLDAAAGGTRRSAARTA